MMTKLDYHRRIESYKREDNAVGCGMVLLVFGALFGMVGLAVLAGRLGDKQNTVAMCGMVIFLFVFLFGMLIASVALTNERLKRHGLLCPSCKASLVGQAEQVIITTKRCGTCGERIIAKRKKRQTEADDDEEDDQLPEYGIQR